ncbi:uncharacterized protein [Medicago truncatula]|nr:uncharacterized protein LOC112422220 [Medicago truncatula]
MENNYLFPAKKQEAEETKFISEEKPPPPVTTKVAKMEYTNWSPFLKENCERYLAKKKEEDRKYLSEILRPPAVKTNIADYKTIADNHTLTTTKPFPKPFPNEGLKVESYNEKMKRKLGCCQPSSLSLNLNLLLDAKQLDKKVEVAKMEYTNWSPFLKENCERYLAKKKEEDRKYLSEILRPPAVKTTIADYKTIADNHTLTTTKPFPNPNEGLKFESFEGDPFATTNLFSKNKEMESKLRCCQPSNIFIDPLLAEERPVKSDTLFVMSDPFLAERVAKRRKVESLEEEPLETTNPVCNPFPAKKEKESKFVRTKPRAAEKHPVMSDPFLAERPPHMFLNIFFSYQQKVEKLAEMLKIESIEGEPQVTTDPLVAKKHHVSTMFLNLFLAYKQEVERVAKMLKKDSIDGEPFLTTDPILAEKPPVLAYQQEVESSKKKEEESNTTNIAEKHTLTYFDDKPVSQPASSCEAAT